MTTLLSEMQARFSNSDLDTLIFYMGWDRDDFPRTKTDKVVAIIEQAKVQNRMKEMLDWCKQINRAFSYVEDKDITETLEWQLNRTLTVVRGLATGKTLTLPNGFTIGMTTDMSVGFVMSKANGEQFVSRLSTMDLKGLNALLNDYNIVSL